MYIFSVSELFDTLKTSLKEIFPLIAVKGEISFIKQSTTGHIYFALKDKGASISCVCWKSRSDALKKAIEENKEVTLQGSITAFSMGTKIFLDVTSIEVEGAAKLLLEIEKTKIKYRDLGYFREDIKKPLPIFPKLIAVISSETGAVIHDIIHRITERFPTKILLVHSAVQGENAVLEIVNAFNKINTLKGKPDVIILARGGGSFEDLMPFNRHEVIEAIYNCQIPVVSAIGHEVDKTLADLTADKNAPTPTAAAEFCTPITKEQLSNNLTNYSFNLKQNSSKIFEFFNNRVNNYSLVLNRQNEKFKNLLARLGNFKEIISISVLNNLTNIKNKLNILKQNIIYPEEILLNHHKNTITLKNDIKNSIFKIINLKSTQLTLNKEVLLSNSKFLNVSYKEHLVSAFKGYFENLPKINFDKKTNLLRNISLVLETYSIEEVLNKGFTLTTTLDGKSIIKSKDSLKNGQNYLLNFKDGTKEVSVKD